MQPSHGPFLNFEPPRVALLAHHIRLCQHVACVRCEEMVVVPLLLPRSVEMQPCSFVSTRKPLLGSHVLLYQGSFTREKTRREHTHKNVTCKRLHCWV